jgi:transposase
LGITKPRHDLREIVNAILYVNRTGIAWEYLPHYFPPHKTVYDYHAKWEKDGVTEAIHDALRGQVREALGAAWSRVRRFSTPRRSRRPAMCRNPGKE